MYATLHGLIVHLFQKIQKNCQAIQFKESYHKAGEQEQTVETY